MTLHSSVYIGGQKSENSASVEARSGKQKVIFGIAELIVELRKRLREDTKNRQLRKTASAVGVSHPWLAKFRDGQAVCMAVINVLAKHYGISYHVSNFDTEELEKIGWSVSSS